MTTRKQAQVIRAINKLSLKFKGIIPKRDLPSVNVIHRNRNFVRIKDVILVIKKLILTQRKQLVHFGLDLYIILLAGMRFLADKDRIQKGVLELLANNEKRETSDLGLTFTMIIGKSDVKQEVCLNTQLYLMLR